MQKAIACAIVNVINIVSSNSQYHLAAVESLGVTAGSIAFHAAQPHEGEKGLRFEPALRVLRLEGFHKVMDLLLVYCCRQRHKQIWLPQVSVVFRDLILQYQVISKRIPG